MRRLAISTILQHGVAIVYRVAGLPITIRAMFGIARDDPMATIRAVYAHDYWRLKQPAEWFELFAALLLWPVGLLLSALWFTGRNGILIAQRTGRSVPAQFLDQVRLFFTAGILPPWYYIFSLHDYESRQAARAFINRCETKQGIYRLLNSRASSPLGDKAAFARHCQMHGLPTIPVLLIAANGELVTGACTPWQLPETDLFLKPVRARGGRGAERWDSIGNGFYQHTSGKTLNLAEFLDRLRRESTIKPRLVQPRLVNHPVLRDLSNGVLTTVRALTCLNEQGRPELVAATFRMAVGQNRTVDNIHAGGIAASINMDTGALSTASNLGINASLGWLAVHPDTRASIEGRVLPMWTEVKALAERAHLAFADRTMIGWDIGLTGDGPILVEGNSGPDVDLMQRPLRQGLGRQRFGQLLAFHLRRMDNYPTRSKGHAGQHSGEAWPV